MTETAFPTPRYQRIEQLIGKQLEQHTVDKDEVMMFLERVTEAQRSAAAELRAIDEAKRDGGKRKGDAGRRGGGNKRKKW